MRSKFILITAIILVLAIKGSCQVHDIAGRVLYVATHRTSLYMPGNNDKIDTTNLYFNDTSSAYWVKTQFKSMETIIKNVENDNHIIDKEAAIEAIHAAMKQESMTIDYHKTGSNVFSRPELILNKNYCVNDTIDAYAWELLPDTTTILGFTCQKAVCTANIVGGSKRPFTAWYAPGIPVPVGPYRFYGLPGLILAIENTYYSYKAVEIKMPLPVTEQMKIECCKGYPLLSRKAAEVMRQKLQSDRIDINSLHN